MGAPVVYTRWTIPALDGLTRQTNEYKELAIIWPAPWRGSAGS